MALEHLYRLGHREIAFFARAEGAFQQRANDGREFRAFLRNRRGLRLDSKKILNARNRWIPNSRFSWNPNAIPPIAQTREFPSIVCPLLESAFRPAAKTQFPGAQPVEMPSAMLAPPSLSTETVLTEWFSKLRPAITVGTWSLRQVRKQLDVCHQPVRDHHQSFHAPVQQHFQVPFKSVRFVVRVRRSDK